MTTDARRARVVTMRKRKGRAFSEQCEAHARYGIHFHKERRPYSILPLEGVTQKFVDAPNQVAMLCGDRSELGTAHVEVSAVQHGRAVVKLAAPGPLGLSEQPMQVAKGLCTQRQGREIFDDPRVPGTAGLWPEPPVTAGGSKSKLTTSAFGW